MKKLQKVLPLLLALALVFSLAACAPKDGAEQPSATPDAATPDVEAPEETVPEDEPTPENGPNDLGDNSAARGAIQAGSWDGDVFTNEWVNISFTLPSDWSALSAEEMQAQIELGLAAAGVDESAAAMQEAAMARSLNDFTIMGALAVPSVTATYENTEGNPLTANLGAEEYFNMLKLQLSSMGIEFGEPEDIVIAGETYLLGKGSIAYGDISMYQSFYLRKLDGAIVMFTAMYMDDSEAAVSDFFASITPAK
ncbi:MAG: hypothetical protein LBK23_11120 [Oscillospiraceae bacterium]|jgi:predicted small lipoprotein YifL|nr:hypothetical protein [Oscillospiraceae bacterium]